MGDVEEMLQRLKKLRNGETVTCKHCGKGIMQPVGNPKTTPCFICDNCHTKLNIN